MLEDTIKIKIQRRVCHVEFIIQSWFSNCA